jgi:acylphosphatase
VGVLAVSSQIVSLRAVVRGRVQGVNFRHFVFTRGRILRLRGYVRNLPDGRSVEVVAEGPRGDLEQLLAHVREGPRMARVDSVDVEWREATGGVGEFDVAY